MKYNMTGNLQSAVVRYELLYNKLNAPETTAEEREQLRNEICSLADECDWAGGTLGGVLFSAMKRSVRNNLDYIAIKADSLSLPSFKPFFLLLKDTCDVWTFVLEGEHYYLNILIHTAAESGYKIVGTTTREEKDEDGNASDTIYGLVFSR